MQATAGVPAQPAPAPPAGSRAMMPVPDERAFRPSPRGFRSSQPPPITPSKRTRTPNYQRVPGLTDEIRSPMVHVLSPASTSAPLATDHTRDYLTSHFQRERRLDSKDHGSFSEVYLVRSLADGVLSAVKKLRTPYKGAKDRYH